MTRDPTATGSGDSSATTELGERDEVVITVAEAALTIHRSLDALYFTQRTRDPFRSGRFSRPSMRAQTSLESPAPVVGLKVGSPSKKNLSAAFIMIYLALHRDSGKPVLITACVTQILALHPL